MRLLLLILMIGVAACSGEDASPGQDPYAFWKPQNFPAASYTFDNNPVTKEGFELGRVLFYDPVLSSDSSIACANCHQQARSFSDPVHRFSRGVGGAPGVRNAPALQNLAFERSFFWDGGVNHLDFVPINAITSEIEMNEKLSNVITKLQRNTRYRQLFSNAFGSPEVDSQKALHALSQFMTLMISGNSRYDRYVRKEGEQLTPEEVDGFHLFQLKCSGCHATDLFTDGSFRNNGLDSTFDDIGRQRISEAAVDRGKFKVPSLRNAELTHPYMHDGRFNTLDEVIDHYRKGIKNSATLDTLLKKGIAITDDEKMKIIAFIKTLTDREFVTDRRFSFPVLN